ncbi:hypothetical protein B9Z55_003382 [Caenorhabditis nigoni]|uniref:DUF7154 domain-containing protein n=1 Tax=Caenorhabditis nigoni TaxID=1611254 RepID=A0A2G5VPX9_9PELO|nr:hypothetical protein B9Z55_003382 [Caenorhabditis nigoni]
MRALQLVLFLSFLSFFDACLVISGFQNDKCTPKDNTTYLLAYSNDIDSEYFSRLYKSSKVGYPVARKFVKLARVRFDVREPEEIEYYDNLNEFLSDTNYSLPDPRLSYNSTSEGSDVVSVLKNFLGKTKSPICGSKINVLMKRLPTEVDVESIVAKLRKFHVEVYFAISERPFGGNTLESLNEIAFKTNGLSTILTDEKLNMGVLHTQHYKEETLIYAANFNVSGKGTIELPPMTVPYDRRIFAFLMSFKDDPVSDALQSATITCTNTVTNTEFVYKYGVYEGYVNFRRTGGSLDKGIYTMKFEYEYANQDVERLFIRVSTLYNTTEPIDPAEINHCTVANC